MLTKTKLQFLQRFLLCGGITLVALSCTAESPRVPFSTVVGTQTIDLKYHFTDENPLVETAKRIQELGCDTLKIDVTDNYHYRYMIGKRDDIKTALDLITKDPSFREVFDMPFRNTMFWLYPFCEDFDIFETGEISEAHAKDLYQEIYDVTAYLLKKYSGTGRSFFIGNWEGDWHLNLGKFEYDFDARPEAIQAAIQWFNIRHDAVKDAIRDTPHEDVYAYFYIELNHIQKALKEDRPAIVNKVLPHIRTDYVSWSSYDTTQVLDIDNPEGEKKVKEALDYIEAHLPPSDLPGKRVLIGEYGYKLEFVQTPELQLKNTAAMIRYGLEWGCPFILYWELYCNEVREDNGKPRGFWMIDDKNVKQPVWYFHKEFLEKANAFVANYEKKNGRLPPQKLYNRKALEWLD